ncbi:MAG: hypothetical protein PHH96_11210, partial [Smithellaceae bacterium]|nr:hypothetical protein [Smithellaceae bacterium]
EEINASYNAKIYCYDNKTEILTDSGWKYFKDVTFEDKVATLNESKTEFHNPTDIQDFVYNGEMYNVETEKGSLLVSPEHKIYAKAETSISAVMMDKVLKNNSITHNPECENKASNLDSFEIAQIMPEILEMQNRNAVQPGDLHNLLLERHEHDWIFTPELMHNAPNLTGVNIHNLLHQSLNSSIVMGLLAGSLMRFLNLSTYSSFNGSSSTGYQSISSQNSWSSAESVPVLRNLSNMSLLSISSVPTSDQLTHTKLSNSALKESSNATVMLTIYNSPLALNSCNFSRRFLSPSLNTSGQLTSGLASILFLTSFDMENVTRFMLNTSCKCVDLCKCVEIYKSFGTAKEVKPENTYGYKLINVQEAYEMLQNGSKISFLDENLSRIEVKAISREAYDGRIYDVTAPNHILLVRRDGLVAWSGNSLYHNFTSLSSGTYTYKAYVVDQAGNLNNTEERTFIVNAVPVVSEVLVNSTYGTNLTTENLTAYVTASEADGDGYTLIYDWRKDGISDTRILMPFDINGSSWNTAVVKDYSSYNVNGSITITANSQNVTWNSSCGAFPGSGGCYEFNKDAPVLSLPTTPSGNPSILNNFSAGEFSMCNWVKFRNVTDRTLFWGGAGSAPIVYGSLASKKVYLYSKYNNTGNSGCTGSIALSPETWYFICYTATGQIGATRHIYVNGTDETGTCPAINETIILNNTLGKLGAYSTNYLNGSIDHLMIWDRTLSASEIAALYANFMAGGGNNMTHSDATTAGDVWYVVVTPADKYEDGTPVASNNVTIASSTTSVTLTSPLDNWYVNNTVKFECFASSNIPLINVSLWHNNTGTWARNATVTTTANS